MMDDASEGAVLEEHQRHSHFALRLGPFRSQAGPSTSLVIDFSKTDDDRSLKPATPALSASSASSICCHGWLMVVSSMVLIPAGAVLIYSDLKHGFVLHVTCQATDLDWILRWFW